MYGVLYKDVGAVILELRNLGSESQPAQHLSNAPPLRPAPPTQQPAVFLDSLTGILFGDRGMYITWRGSYLECSRLASRCDVPS
ncbi:hypothetical protein EMPG_15613 [Blastomyces silverae]|uniref:Uncharacterized protein n=1 Tax=Blastomyces silverae TaxID=2060906 RepID=A0A0H1BC83_9EURO|nr:hypothetical protein EMPG_15613 [Blastomyces silverae]